jgi:hypothetical protein
MPFKQDYDIIDSESEEEATLLHRARKFKQMFYDSKTHSTEQNCLTAIGLSLGVVVFIAFVVGPFLALDIASLIIAEQYGNSTCFQDHQVMDLTHFLLSSAIVSQVFFWTFFIITILYYFTDYQFIFAKIFWIVYIIYFFADLVLFILGAVELSNSYLICIGEVRSVCILVIIKMVIIGLFLFGGGVKHSRD